MGTQGRRSPGWRGSGRQQFSGSNLSAGWLGQGRASPEDMGVPPSKHVQSSGDRHASTQSADGVLGMPRAAGAESGLGAHLSGSEKAS